LLYREEEREKALGVLVVVSVNEYPVLVHGKSFDGSVLLLIFVVIEVVIVVHDVPSR
jgi:hypothetical protein